MLKKKKKKKKKLPEEAVWIWSDGSTEAVWPMAEVVPLSTPQPETTGKWAPMGRLCYCSSTRAELTALLAALEAVVELPGCEGLRVGARLDSKAALLVLLKAPRPGH